MQKNTNKISLADQISGILTTAPSFDPDDDLEKPQVVDKNTPEDQESQVDDSEEEVLISKFRRQNIDLLEDVDRKYSGTKSSRKQLKDSEDETSEESDSNDEENDKEEEDSEEESESGEEQEEGDSEDDDISITEGQDENKSQASFKTIDDSNDRNTLGKANCVRNQMRMWENLLEARIQLQKCLITANKMPLSHTFKELKQSDPTFSNKVSETRNSVGKVLDNLMLLQNLLIKQYPETKDLEKSEVKKSDSDEEIPSDTDQESSADEEANNGQPRIKKMKLADYESDISTQHTRYCAYRNNIIQKWNDKTRLTQKGGAAPNHSIIHQIDYNLSNKEKLIKRTQLKRSNYQILGHDPVDSEQPAQVPEIFDDDDFYHQLLRELIEVKSANVTDPVQLGRQWIQLQNLRSKMKRKIDTRATKGRKIRYAIHTKLVNYMAPIDENLWFEDAKTELFNSLFGKNS